MVSDGRYWSFKGIDRRRGVPFYALVALTLALLLVLCGPPLVLFGFFVGYAASGYLLFAWTRLRR